jgi:hypothetical protein
MDTDSSRDTVSHNPTVSTALTYPIYQSPPESDSKGRTEVYMVGQGDELHEKTDVEIAHEIEEEIT